LLQKTKRTFDFWLLSTAACGGLTSAGDGRTRNGISPGVIERGERKRTVEVSNAIELTLPRRLMKNGHYAFSGLLNAAYRM
jgi:hypothetical protein